MAEGFSGMDQLLDDMRNLPDELKGEAAKQIMGAANGMEAELKQGYARGETGNLIRGVGQRHVSPLHVEVRSRAPHAHLYEFGTVQRHNKANANRGTMPAKPVFIPAASRRRKRMLEGFREMLRRAKVRGMTGSAL